MSKALPYRPEIDGLRALAVAAVIVFHLNPAALTGGFLGVDVFFVISGYLITLIIARKLIEGTFSLREFWLRRFRRLYPALTVMVATVAVAGHFLMVSPERQELPWQALGALFSFSNVLLWRTTGGYWDTESESIPLLHTWSLSLEEQFYAVFPLLLVLLFRLRRQWVLPALLVLASCSFVLCVVATPGHQKAAFYLLPTRMWELLIGGLVALLELRRGGSLLSERWQGPVSFFGLAAVLASLWAMDGEGFPGAYPAVTVFGTALLLAAARGPSLIHTFLAGGLLRYVGRISYSLYLWHWPVIVFAAYLSPEGHPLLLLALILALGAASYHFVETPMREGFHGRRSLAAGLPLAAGLCVLPLFLNSSRPWLPDDLTDLESPEALSQGWQYDATQLILHGQGGVFVGPDDERPSLVLLGSSHARVLSTPFAEFAESSDLPTLVMATPGVHLTLDAAHTRRRDAADVNHARLDYLRHLHPEVVVVAEMWSVQVAAENFTERLGDALREIADVAGHVVVVSQVPMFALPERYDRSLRKYLVAAGRAGAPDEIAPADEVTAANRVVQAVVSALADPRIVFVDIHDDLVEHDTVRAYVNGQITYFDSHHVNDRGARHVFEHSIRPVITRFLEEPPATGAPAFTSRPPSDPSGAL